MAYRVEHGGRKSGRTFRILLNALRDVSDGKDLIYVASSPNHARDLFERTLSVLGTLIPAGYKVFSDGKYIQMAGGGSIKFEYNRHVNNNQFYQYGKSVQMVGDMD